jgi:uncharacterized membrane protein YuzA (DUF378 family)
VLSKTLLILIGCLFGSAAGIFPSNLMMFYGFTVETFSMSVPFIVIGLVGVVVCFHFAHKTENVKSEI